MSGRYAILIGNTEYNDATLSQLTSPNADVYGLEKVFKDPAIGGFDEVRLLVNNNFLEITKAIAQMFAAKKNDDTILLYFSGHGVLDEDGKLYLAVKETERDILSATAISSNFISNEMNKSRSRRQILILDCCHSGAFDRGQKSSIQRPVGTASAFEGEGYGRFVLTATDTTQYAWEGDKIIGNAEKSIFTHFLIEGLETGKADSDSDGLITLDELYDYIHRNLLDATSRQTPGKWTYKAQGDVIIGRNPKSTSFSAISLRIPNDLQRAIVSSFPGVRKGAISELAILKTTIDEEVSADSKLALEYLINDSDQTVSENARLALYGETELQSSMIVAKGREGAISTFDKISINAGFGVELSMLKIPAGKFLMGSRPDNKFSEKNQFPQHAVFISDYWISQYPITVNQFSGFVKATSYKTTAEIRGGGQAWRDFKWQDVKGGNWRKPFGSDTQRKNTKNDPVVFMSWHDAIAFCKWLTSTTGIFFDLPTEAQWEKAARGTDARNWPWGNQHPDTSICNFGLNLKQTSPVGTYSPSGDSYYNCADMAGNVWEWTNSILRPYPYQDNYDGTILAKNDTRVLRGGSFRSFAKRVCTTYRMEQPIDACVDGYGFRVTAEINSSPSLEG